VKEGSKHDLFECKKHCSKGPADRRKTTLAVNAILLDEEQMIHWDWGILLRTRCIATSAALATTLAIMMRCGMMKKPHESDAAAAAAAVVFGDTGFFDTFKTCEQHC
jgi:hypothetical protein